MSSDPKPEDIKKAAHNKALMWYRRIENRVAPVVAFGGLIAENTTRWAFEKRNQHDYKWVWAADSVQLDGSAANDANLHLSKIW